MRRLLLACLSLVLVGLIAAAAGAGLAWRELHRPVAPAGSPLRIEVQPGDTLRAVARRLHESGVLRFPDLLVLWARWAERDRSIRSGTHVMDRPMSPVELLDLLHQPPQVDSYWVTIPEGFTAREIAAALEDAGLGGRDVFACVMQDAALLAELDLPATGVEGYLFPDTYSFTARTTPEEIVRTMVEHFRTQVQEFDDLRRTREMTVHEMVTLASIIEKETGRAGERRRISGVFHNRLQRGMRLQSDPTVIYGLRDFDGNLRRADLSDPSPYNTYVHARLPPGPIANPGRAALEAAVDPADTDALYFVARGDGSHHFSRTLREHNRAVWKYQKRR